VSWNHWRRSSRRFSSGRSGLKAAITRASPHRSAA
jgi:hypothetical protein